MPYSAWAWDEARRRHYCCLLDDEGNVKDYIWSGGEAPTTGAAGDEATPRHNPETSAAQPIGHTTSPVAGSHSNYTYGSQYGGRTTSGGYSVATRPDSGYGHNVAVANYGSSAYGASRAYAGTSQLHQTSSSSSSQRQGYYATSPPSQSAISYSTTTSPPPPLPQEVQDIVNGDKQRRFIRTGNDGQDTELLDPRYRRVTARHQAYFFIPGRVFKMLWTEPAGIANPGRTRGSTHFSRITFGEYAYSEIRRFVVISPRGTFSQCLPIQTYRRQGTLKPGLRIEDHGQIYTAERGEDPPSLLDGEVISKQAIRIDASAGEVLEAESRINYGKPYAVEHNVKVLEIGKVAQEYIHLLQIYYQETMRAV